MSSRITSELGTLGERVARQEMRSATTPCHVDVLVDIDGGSRWVPGLLAAWERQSSGWWGRVAVVDPAGDLVEFRVVASRLRRAT